MISTDLRIKSPACVILSGSSSCGKSTLIENILINHSECFQEPIEEVHWVYAKHADDQQLFERLRTTFKPQQIPIDFHENFPSEEIRQNTLFKKDKSKHKIVIFDDVCHSPKNIPALFDIWNVLSHHQNFTAILVVQNLAGSTPTEKSCLSTLLRSTTYLILFANRRMIPVIRSLAINYFPGETHRALEPLKYLLKQGEPYKYLLFDFTAEDEDLIVREGGLLPNESCYAFIFKNETN